MPDDLLLKITLARLLVQLDVFEQNRYLRLTHLCDDVGRLITPHTADYWSVSRLIGAGDVLSDIAVAS